MYSRYFHVNLASAPSVWIQLTLSEIEEGLGHSPFIFRLSPARYSSPLKSRTGPRQRNLQARGHFLLTNYIYTYRTTTQLKTPHDSG